MAGGALMLLAQSPNMSHAEVLTAVTTGIMVTYSLVAVVLAIIQGEPAHLPAWLLEALNGDGSSAGWAPVRQAGQAAPVVAPERPAATAVLVHDGMMMACRGRAGCRLQHPRVTHGASHERFQRNRNL